MADYIIIAEEKMGYQGPQGPMGDVTPEALAAKSAAEAAAASASATAANFSAVTDMLSPYYARLNQQYLAEVARKLRYGEPINITFYGDSNSVRSNSLMQQSFLNAVNGIYNNIHGRIDRGYSGDTAKLGYNRWTATHTGDISIICYGTNDSTSNYGYPDTTRCHDYQYWMEKLITRELNWGKAVIIVSPLPIRNDKRWETKTQHFATDPYPDQFRADVYPFNGICRLLAEKYSAPFFDSKEALNNYEDDIFALSNSNSLATATSGFGDVVHYTDDGLKIWGFRLASIFYGDSLINPRAVYDGTAFATRKGEDPFTTNAPVLAETPSKRVAYINNYAFAVGDNTSGKRGLQLWANEQITYSFYCPSDDLMVYPCLYVFANSSADIKLDYGIRQPHPVLDEALNFGGNNGEPLLTITATSIGNINLSKNYHPSSTVSGITYSNKGIRIMSRGWHTLTLTTTSGYVLVSGIRFKSHENELIYDTNTIQKLTTGDLNSLYDGLYYVPDTTGNIPVAYPGLVKQCSVKSDTSVVFQEFYPYGATSYYWTRYAISSVWQPWMQIK